MVPPTKQQIRHAMLEKRQALSDEERAAAAVSLRVRLASAVGKGLAVAGYAPIRGELDVLPALEALFGKGHVLGLPVSGEGREMPLIFRRWQPGDALVRGKYNVQEPGDDAPEFRPDLVLVPLVAFDERGYRIGYGAGYYDRTIHALRQAAKPPRFVGVAHVFQRVAQVPAEPHDERLDEVIAV